MYSNTIKDGYLEGSRWLDEYIAKYICFQTTYSRFAPQSLDNTTKSLKAVDCSWDLKEVKYRYY